MKSRSYFPLRNTASELSKSSTCGKLWFLSIQLPRKSIIQTADHTTVDRSLVEQNGSIIQALLPGNRGMPFHSKSFLLKGQEENWWMDLFSSCIFSPSLPLFSLLSSEFHESLRSWSNADFTVSLLKCTTWMYYCNVWEIFLLPNKQGEHKGQGKHIATSICFISSVADILNSEPFS